MEVYTDFPERLQVGKTIFAGAARQNLTIRSQRKYKDGLLLAFEGLETPEGVGHLRNQLLYIRGQDAQPLAEGEHYYFELLGVRVFDDNGVSLGSLVEVIETGANDVYVVQGETGSQILLPAIPEVILDLNTESKEMKVHLLPGLLGGE